MDLLENYSTIHEKPAVMPNTLKNHIIPLSSKIKDIEIDLNQAKADIQEIKKQLFNEKENIPPNLQFIRHSTKRDLEIQNAAYKPGTIEYQEVKNKLVKTETAILSSTENGTGTGTGRNVFAARKISKDSASRHSISNPNKVGIITPFKCSRDLNESKEKTTFKGGLKHLSRTRCSKKLQTILKRIDKIKPPSLHSPACHSLLKYHISKSNTQRGSKTSREKTARIPKAKVATKLKPAHLANTKEKTHPSLFRVMRKLSREPDQSPSLANQTTDGLLQSTARQSKKPLFFTTTHRSTTEDQFNNT